MGCRVSTLLGHDPNLKSAPMWKYSITLPEGVTLPERTYIKTEDGLSEAFRDPWSARRVLVYGRVNAQNAADLLTRIADTLEG